MADESVGESEIVTAIGVSVNGIHELHAQRINDAVVAEILKCNAEGISTEEQNSAIIRERMMLAHERESAAIQAEIEAAQG